jgi:predicted nucleotidyltransferase
MYGLSEQNIAQIQQVLGKFPEIKQAILYGSRAKGNYKIGSDIDLTLIGENINLQIINKIDLALDDLLLPYFFDISNFKQIENTDLLEHINRVGKPLFQKKAFGI